ncbi:hypothetical protein NC653_026911 [Populus alba x Populus x berolinensis]|uniref:Uncharacterized protein n=1 Tax=Populus alba x Populus x berolinensis TaxID=444605 RepID=A0AAD6Q4G6_9ROSI|nr:hypothetical protein NC653_026911 [Populus alba x Populus x berolinensis]
MREDRDTARAGAQREWMSWIMRVSNVPFEPLRLLIQNSSHN